MSKSMVDITIETAMYYAEDPEKRRGLKQHAQAMVDKGPPTFMCVYYYENEIGEVVNCAIGRVLLKEVAIQMQHCSGSAADLIAEYQEEEGYETDNYSRALDCMLKEEYRGHPLNFWESLQSFHDGDQYWDYDKGGLSPMGLEHLEYMCASTLDFTDADCKEVKNACIPLVKR